MNRLSHVEWNERCKDNLTYRSPSQESTWLGTHVLLAHIVIYTKFSFDTFEGKIQLKNLRVPKIDHCSILIIKVHVREEKTLFFDSLGRYE